ncbi:RNA-binding S4 domain-containing protein [Simiduia aestuariiviva]|uniref:Ribosome-associated protein n=1 Tax=Simiduia aestuariiviva TaxID=1510459 RepID=A0A839UGD9_9GAMM|nr:RNA-binding S4 domain-containing protein [Simiduia aestuariiviva]MBB3167114.1 ribosome-associated protein [Simiduia aestuariiviva]
MQRVAIDREPVELYKILKFEGLCASGAEAKNAVADGLVQVNGEQELRKRRQIVGGDVIEFNGDVLSIVLETSG